MGRISSYPIRRIRTYFFMCATAFFTMAQPAYSADSISLELGSGNKTRLARVGVQWAWDAQWDVFETARLSGYWDLGLAYWHGKRHQDVEDSEQNLAAIGIVPVFRLTPKEMYGPYVEVGIGGPHLLSERYDNNRRQLSTNFQFGSHLGLGYVFSSKLDVSLRYQHYSNASIKKPNDGVNFLILRLAYPL
jgi:lipid A 3-O-deacylase